MKNIEEPGDDSDKLVIVWTSSDVNVAEHMVFMYTHAAISKNFFDKVILIIWGPSAKLAVENLNIQQKLLAMQNDGLIVQACIACAKEFDVEEELDDLGFEVKAMGIILTGYLKNNARVLTF